MSQLTKEELQKRIEDCKSLDDDYVEVINANEAFKKRSSNINIISYYKRVAERHELERKNNLEEKEIYKLALKQLEGQEAKENYCLGCLDYGLKDDGTSGCTIPEDEEFVCRVRERHDYCCGNCEHWKNGLCTNHENIEVTCRYYAIGDEIVVSIKKESTDYCSGWVES